MKGSSLAARLTFPCLALILWQASASSPSAAAPGPGGAASVGSKTTGLGPIFPPSNPWNQDISKLAVHENSAKFMESIGAAKGLHADFGTTLSGGVPNGIPYVVVKEKQALFPVEFTEYGEE